MNSPVPYSGRYALADPREAMPPIDIKSLKRARAFLDKHDPVSSSSVTVNGTHYEVLHTKSGSVLCSGTEAVVVR